MCLTSWLLPGMFEAELSVVTANVRVSIEWTCPMSHSANCGIGSAFLNSLTRFEIVTVYSCFAEVVQPPAWRLTGGTEFSRPRGIPPSSEVTSSEQRFSINQISDFTSLWGLQVSALLLSLTSRRVRRVGRLRRTLSRRCGTSYCPQLRILHII